MIAVLTVLGIGVAGAAGATVRAAVLRVSGPSGGTRRAAAVAGVNLAGAVLLALLQVVPMDALVRTVLGVGFCGSLSTFSTWMLEACRRVDAGRSWWGVATVDLAAQLAIGVLLVATVLRAV